MKLILLNLIVICIWASPQAVLYGLRSRSRWIDDNHGWLGFVAWVATGLLVYTWILPKLGLKPNLRFFQE
jgi:hypothetical protein